MHSHSQWHAQNAECCSNEELVQQASPEAQRSIQIEQPDLQGQRQAVKSTSRDLAGQQGEGTKVQTLPLDDIPILPSAPTLGVLLPFGSSSQVVSTSPTHCFSLFSINYSFHPSTYP